MTVSDNLPAYAGDMPPAPETLERVLADLFREVSTAARLAEMSGLDVTQIDRTGSVADVWHSVITLARQDGTLERLIERAQEERPRNQALQAAWLAFRLQGGGAAQPQDGRRTTPPAMSEETMRIDQLQRDLAALQVQVAVTVEQNKTIIAQQQAMALSQAALQKRLLNLFWLLVAAVLVVGVLMVMHISQDGATYAISRGGVDGGVDASAAVGGVVVAVLWLCGVGVARGGAVVDSGEDD